ncbi:MAG: leucyl aminopeptidase [Nitrospinales bacterium]
MTKIIVKEADPFKHKTQCMVILCREEKTPSGILTRLDKVLNGAILSCYKGKKFEGKLNQKLWLNAGGGVKAENILLIGSGKAGDITEDRFRQAGGSGAKHAEKNKCKSISIALPDWEFKLPKGSETGACIRSVIEGVHLSLYHFDQYKSQDKDSPKNLINDITILSPSKGHTSIVKTAMAEAEKLTEGVMTARNLISHPGNTATPAYLANTAKKIAGKGKLTCKVLGVKEMKKLGMGALLGVGQGSAQPPAFIILEYKGGKKNQAPVALVGKGVTFDTGGISLKPGGGMDEMKYDMSGGATVIGTLQAAANLKLPVNVVGLIPTAENMPGSNAIKPGDILTSLSGKTIEVLNTDAEGRLILADALAYADRLKPKAVIDLATLTGACVVALGHQAAAVVGTDPKLIEKLKASGDKTGERVWELPLYEEFDNAVKSDIADLKNISSPGVGAGTITASAFLKAFVGDNPWAHLDIAGVAWSKEEKPYIPRGAAGFGVRLLIDYLKSL